MLSAHQKRFMHGLEDLMAWEGWRIGEAMRAYLVCASSAIRKTTCCGPDADDQEAAYMRIVSLCRKPEKTMHRLAEMHGAVVLGLEDEIHDFLGPLFMETVSNAAMGQFFTPDPLCQMMAELQLADAPAQLAAKGWLSISEPAGGTGGMLLACCRFLKAQGINYQRLVYFQLTDLDLDAFQGAYIQLSLVGAAARVIHGNTLSQERRQTAITPMLLLQPWLETRTRAGPGPERSAPPEPSDFPAAA